MNPADKNPAPERGFDDELAAEARACKTQEEVWAFEARMHELGFERMETAIFVCLERYPRDGTTTAPL